MYLLNNGNGNGNTSNYFGVEDIPYEMINNHDYDHFLGGIGKFLGNAVKGIGKVVGGALGIGGGNKTTVVSDPAQAQAMGAIAESIKTMNAQQAQQTQQLMQQQQQMQLAAATKPKEEPKQDTFKKYLPWIIGGVVFVVIIVILAVTLRRK